MSEIIVFDVATYRLSGQTSQTRREDLNPERNIVITAGFSDGRKRLRIPMG